MYSFFIFFLFFIATSFSSNSANTGNQEDLINEKSFAAEEKFVVKEKHTSKNQLKEQLGETFEELHHKNSKLSKTIATIQYNLAESQEQVLEQAKKLLNNDAPFNKTNKEELKKIQDHVNGLIEQVETLTKTLEKNLDNKKNKGLVKETLHDSD
jgi:Mg2+ and Co2+ transporter CorA